MPNLTTMLSPALVSAVGHQRRMGVGGVGGAGGASGAYRPARPEPHIADYGGHFQAPQDYTMPKGLGLKPEDYAYLGGADQEWIDPDLDDQLRSQERFGKMAAALSAFGGDKTMASFGLDQANTAANERQGIITRNMMSHVGVQRLMADREEYEQEQDKLYAASVKEDMDLFNERFLGPNALPGSAPVSFADALQMKREILRSLEEGVEPNIPASVLSTTVDPIQRTWLEARAGVEGEEAGERNVAPGKRERVGLEARRTAYEREWAKHKAGYDTKEMQAAEAGAIERAKQDQRPSAAKTYKNPEIAAIMKPLDKEQTYMARDIARGLMLNGNWEDEDAWGAAVAAGHRQAEAHMAPKRLKVATEGISRALQRGDFEPQTRAQFPALLSELLTMVPDPAQKGQILLDAMDRVGEGGWNDTEMYDQLYEAAVKFKVFQIQGQ